jgi:hypothetical protein
MGSVVDSRGRWLYATCVPVLLVVGLSLSSCSGGGSSGSAASSASSPTAPASNAGPAGLSGVVGKQFSGVVAAIASGNCGCTATIDWGDGSNPSPAKAARNNRGGVEVTGSHTYRSAGTYSIVVNLVLCATECHGPPGARHASTDNNDHERLKVRSSSLAHSARAIAGCIAAALAAEPLGIARSRHRARR